MYFEQVSIGIIDENPSTIAGTIAIMEVLHNYVPSTPDYLLFIPIPCHGDQLSVERERDGKRSRAANATGWERLEGLIETPQEFHKDAILYQVMLLKYTSFMSHINTFGGV